MKTTMIAACVFGSFWLLSGCSGVADEEPLDVSATESANTVDGKVCARSNEGGTVTLKCPRGQTITSIDFASYGLPTGSCGAGFAVGTCHATSSKSKVRDLCLNQPFCRVLAANTVFGDPCPGKDKNLAVTYTCSASCNPAKEFNRKYVSTDPRQCRAMFYACKTAGTKPFSNACGCGCEQPSDCPEWINCMPAYPPTSCNAKRARCPLSRVAY